MSNVMDLGWAEPFKSAFLLHQQHEAELEPARVATAQRDGYVLLTERGAVTGTLSGRLRQKALQASDLPTVGDWVATRRAADRHGVIVAVLPRRSLLARADIRKAGAQPIAANLDSVFIAMAVNRDFNLRRLERYLALVHQSGAQPLVLLTKADLATTPADMVEQARTVALDAPVLSVSVQAGTGLEQLSNYLNEGQTTAIVGSSGVGKSTLANALLGEDRLATSTVRAGDDRGRHKTSHRELCQLPGGAWLIDTPGLREVGLWDASPGLSQTFEDVENLARRCRFHDCQHRSEPGCGVLAGLSSGQLTPERYASYLKLQAELAYAQRRENEQERRAHTETLRRRARAYRHRRRHNPKL